MYYVYVFLDLNQPGNYVVRDSKGRFMYRFAYKPIYAGMGRWGRHQDHEYGHHNYNPELFEAIICRRINPKVVFPFRGWFPWMACYEESRIIRAFGLRSEGGLLINKNRGKFPWVKLVDDCRQLQLVKLVS